MLAFASYAMLNIKHLRIFQCNHFSFFFLLDINFVFQRKHLSQLSHKMYIKHKHTHTQIHTQNEIPNLNLRKLNKILTTYQQFLPIKIKHVNEREINKHYVWKYINT